MRFLLLHVSFLLLVLSSLAYIEELRKESKVYVQEKSIARNISIKVFGKGGEEWEVKGRELISFGKELYLLDVLLSSKSGYKVRADSITFQREKNKGILKGNVEIRGEALFVRTDEAVVDFNKNLLSGKSYVQVWRGMNYIEGKGFKAYLKPLRVIIGRVRTKHEV